MAQRGSARRTHRAKPARPQLPVRAVGPLQDLDLCSGRTGWSRKQAQMTEPSAGPGEPGAQRQLAWQQRGPLQQPRPRGSTLAVKPAAAAERAGAAAVSQVMPCIRRRARAVQVAAALLMAPPSGRISQSDSCSSASSCDEKHGLSAVGPPGSWLLLVRSEPGGMLLLLVEMRSTCAASEGARPALQPGLAAWLGDLAALGTLPLNCSAAPWLGYVCTCRSRGGRRVQARTVRVRLRRQVVADLCGTQPMHHRRGLRCTHEQGGKLHPRPQGAAPHLKGAPSQPGQPVFAGHAVVARVGLRVRAAGAAEQAVLCVLHTPVRAGKAKWAGQLCSAARAERPAASSPPLAAHNRTACRLAWYSCCFCVAAARRRLRRRSCTPSPTTAAAHTTATGTTTAATGKEPSSGPSGAFFSQTVAL